MLYCPQHNYGNPSINVDSALMSIAKRMYLKNVESGSMTILFGNMPPQTLVLR